MRTYRSLRAVGSLCITMLAFACAGKAKRDDGAAAGTTPTSSSAGSGSPSMPGGTAPQKPPAMVATQAGTNGGAGMLSTPAHNNGSAGAANPTARPAGAPAASAAGMPASAMGSAGSAASDAGSVSPTIDYAMKGPFDDAKMFVNEGPGGNYTIFRPDASLGRDGFKHPLVGWANGIGTTPEFYQETLTLIATHGFVIIGTNDTQAEEPAVSMGLDWLAMQNGMDGPFKDKLDPSKEALLGYSWGGGAAIDSSHRPNVKCTASLHGMPPRNADAFEKMHAPLLLFTSTGDTFVSADGFVTPNYMKSNVQSFYATLDDPMAGHMYGLDATEANSVACEAGESLGLGPCGSAEKERAPAIAWLRLWVFEDQGARRFFDGDDCLLCSAPWMSQRKMWP